MTGPRITVIGDALVDVLRAPGSDLRVAGGSALNVAIGLTLLGSSATLIATLGDDADGDLVRQALADHDVELLATPSSLGTSVATSERVDGEPRYGFNDAARARTVRIGEAEARALDRSDLVVVSGFPFDDDAQHREVVGRVRDPGERLLVDPNPRLGLMRDRTRFARNLESTAASSRLVKIGHDDVELLWGPPAETVAARLVASGARQVLCTLGERGADLYTADVHSGVVRGGGQDVVHSPVADLPGPIVDTMGAGDATLTTFAHVIANGETDAGATLARAMRIAAATCRRPGALLQID